MLLSPSAIIFPFVNIDLDAVVVVVVHGPTVVSDAVDGRPWPLTSDVILHRSLAARENN